ncbi:hypothetical protein H2241_01535 [Pantoea ananatis]|uniref:hypothetical protein n=1 Tax=Pantoea ananas TaxID=553 RepID=UPI0015888980|nr:hypothetical protein [Pantoea ananatis]MBA4819673.1 hypothetical protein [Pantoea ananatis]QKV86525.1 hypothetical protein FOB88_04970 [Pantoea ananatis]
MNKQRHIEFSYVRNGITKKGEFYAENSDIVQNEIISKICELEQIPVVTPYARSHHVSEHGEQAQELIREGVDAKITYSIDGLEHSNPLNLNSFIKSFFAI